MKRYKVSIIGAGWVGTQSAFLLVKEGFCDVSLIDINGNLAKGKALDLKDFSSFSAKYLSIKGYKDISSIKNSDIVVVTAGVRRSPGMERRELLDKNISIVKEISLSLKRMHFRGFLIMVTNPLDIMTYISYKILGLPRERVIGMGQILDTARLKSILSSRLSLNPSSIHTLVIGEHGKFMVPLFSKTFIGPSPLSELLSEKEIEDIKDELISQGARIVSFLGRGSAYLAPASGVFEIIKSIVFNERKIIPVSVYLRGESGQRNLCIGYPCLLSFRGAQPLSFSPSLQEKKWLFEASRHIKQVLASIEKKC